MQTDLTRDHLWTILRDVVAEMVAPNGVEPEDIERGSMLSGDFGLTSVDTIHMMISLEDQLGDDLDMENLVLRDGEYVDDLSMGVMHDYLAEQLGLAG